MMTAMILLAGALLMASPEQDFSRMVVLDDQGNPADLPLEHTEAHISVEGTIQLVTVRQVYGNPFSDPIEAVYVFPLPDDGAVTAWTCRSATGR